MTYKYKAVFLPADERILNQYKGYLLDGKPVVNVKDNEIFTVVYQVNSEKKYSVATRILLFLFGLILLPTMPFFALIGFLLKRLPYFFADYIFVINAISHLILGYKYKVYQSKEYKKNYQKVLWENVPLFLEHCKKHDTKVYLYSYHQLNTFDEQNIENLFKLGLVQGYKQLDSISDLSGYINAENVSIHNSIIIVKKVEEITQAATIGFNPNASIYNQRSIFLWKEYNHYAGKTEAEKNSRASLNDFEREIDCEIKATRNNFFSNKVILFIEDEHDELLNSFIANNLDRFNKILASKGMVFIYYPILRDIKLENNKLILDFIRSYIPNLYALTDEELNLILQKSLDSLSPKDFYSSIISSLELPYFKKPCLLRNIYGGYNESINKFRTRAIEYNSVDDLEKFFNTLIQKVEIPDDYKGVFFSLKKPPEEYDADWYFSKELSKDSEELKAKIDAIKAKGEFGLLAEAMLYMMETIKNEHPEILKKIKPLIENKKLLQTNVALSPIVIDKHFNIFLPQYGNTEVKMHALPKTVFLLFLRYPNGIKFKELFEYKSELLDIYNKVTNKSEKDEIAKTIDDLVDMRNPSINQKCARVREAFRNIMEEHLAKSYYIDGYNSEPKKISLPRSLVTFTD